MLEIDRAQDDERPAPTAMEATVARDAAREALAQLRRERETLPALVSEAVQRGDFETSRALKDRMALLADHVAFAEGQLVRAECVLLECQLVEAEREARGAAEGLLRTFDAEERARAAHQEATARRAGQQAQQQALQMRVEGLRREHAAARRRLDADAKEQERGH